MLCRVIAAALTAEVNTRYFATYVISMRRSQKYSASSSDRAGIAVRSSLVAEGSWYS